MRNVFVRHSKSRRRNPWFDGECFSERKKLRRLLHTFSRTLRNKDRDLYVEHRREYKKLLLTKKLSYNRNVTDRMNSNLRNPKLFWQQVRKINFKRKPQTTISLARWVEHFRGVLQPDTPPG